MHATVTRLVQASMAAAVALASMPHTHAAPSESTDHERGTLPAQPQVREPLWSVLLPPRLTPTDHNDEWWMQAQHSGLMWIRDRGEPLVVSEDGEVHGQMSLCIAGVCVGAPGQWPQPPYARIAGVAVVPGGGAWALRTDVGAAPQYSGVRSLLRLTDELAVEQEIDVTAWDLGRHAEVLAGQGGAKIIAYPNEDNGYQLTWVNADHDGARTQHGLLAVLSNHTLSVS